MSPTITVLMPVYNREAFVSDAIESVLAQDFNDFELLLVDDGSTDRTPAVLRDWAQRDSRVVIVTSPTNQGIPSALNVGLQHARGKYVARLDSDDLMLSGRLKAQAAVLDAREDVVLVSCAYEIVDEHDRDLGTWRGDEPPEAVAYFLHFYNIVGGGGQVMFRRDEVRAVGGYDARFPASEDFDLWVRLLRRGRIETLPLVGMRKREHDANITRALGGKKHASWRAIMRPALTLYLQRDVAEHEVNALITLWRHDGVRGHAAIADRVMREAFARFRREHRDVRLQRAVRDRTVKQWMEASRRFAEAGERVESMRYVARAWRWRYLM